MAERKQGTNPIEIKAHPDVQHARDLFIQLFENASPFFDLGYNPSQVERALIALRQLENEVAKFYPASGRVNFSSVDELYTASISRSRLGGWRLEVYDNHLALAMRNAPTPKDAILAWVNADPKLSFFEQEGIGMMGIFYALQESVDYKDLNLLIPHLYDDEYYSMLQHGPISRLRAKLFPWNATYRAAWMDDQTKLDLVVHIQHKYLRHGVFKETDGKIDVWRKLPQQELDGVIWVPFGRKPNTSSEQAMGVFESQKGFVTGKLTLSPQRF